MQPDLVLEREGFSPSFIYWILQGEIHFYKKIDDLYYNNGKDLIDAEIEPVGQIIEFKSFGNHIFSMKGDNILVGENAVLGEKLMDYTLVAGSNLVVWRYPAMDVLKAFPHDTID